MSKTRIAAIGAVASLALLAGVGAAVAQNARTSQGRVIEVPPGSIVVVLPGGAMTPASFGFAPLAGPTLDAAFPMPALPDPGALFRQVDQMMADMQRAFSSHSWMRADGTTEAALREAAGPVEGMMVTSFSNGHGVCTKRVVWSGNGAAPKVNVSSTGDACAAEGQPVESQPVPQPTHAAPQLWRAEYHTPVATAPLHG